MDTPLFTKSFDFLSWLLKRTESFPRSQRFVVTKRLQDAMLNFQEFIIEANGVRGSFRLKRLDQADAELDKVRLYLRLCFQWKWLSEGQYHHAAHHVTEMGRLLGAWKKTTRQ